MLNGATCNATHTHGCTRFAPTTTVGNLPTGVAVNQATGTLYVGNRADGDLSVIDPRRCNAGHLRGCRRAWPTVKAGVTPEALAVDERTDTIYTTNSDPDNGYLGDTVSVIDGATCNAHTTSGCRATPGTIKVGNGPNTIAVNPRTDTVYVTNANDNTMSVINGATCNATVRSGCGQTPATITVPAGDFAGSVAVNPKTDTVYFTLERRATGVGGVDVINGATCNGTVRTGCRPATVTMRLGSYAGKLVVDQRTDTVYVLNIGGNDVSVVDGATCNAHVTRGCHRTAPTMALDEFPTGIGLNPMTGAVYVDSFGASDVWVFDGARLQREGHRGLQPAAEGGGHRRLDRGHRREPGHEHRLRRRPGRRRAVADPVAAAGPTPIGDSPRLGWVCVLCAFCDRQQIYAARFARLRRYMAASAARMRSSEVVPSCG